MKVKVFVTQSCLTLCYSMDCGPSGPPGKNTGMGCPARDPPNPGIKARSPALQADFLQSEPPGKPITKL